jgi:hypothetical protein
MAPGGGVRAPGTKRRHDFTPEETGKKASSRIEYDANDPFCTLHPQDLREGVGSRNARTPFPDPSSPQFAQPLRDGALPKRKAGKIAKDYRPDRETEAQRPAVKKYKKTPTVRDRVPL